MEAPHSTLALVQIRLQRKREVRIWLLALAHHTCTYLSADCGRDYIVCTDGNVINIALTPIGPGTGNNPKKVIFEISGGQQYLTFAFAIDGFNLAEIEGGFDCQAKG